MRFGLAQLYRTPIPTQLSRFDYDHLNNSNSRDIEAELVLLTVSSSGQYRAQIDAVKRIHRPKAVLLLADPDEITPAMYGAHAVVRGLVKKDATPELLKASVRLVLAGGSCFPVYRRPAGESPFLSYEPVKWPPEAGASESKSHHTDEAKLLGLTPRQYEVLVLLPRLKTVGKRLNISVATAKRTPKRSAAGCIAITLPPCGIAQRWSQYCRAARSATVHACRKVAAQQPI